MVRRGTKMVALYGADGRDARPHHADAGLLRARDGWFRAPARGGRRFTVQLIPLRDNFHELPAMEKLATKLSPSLAHRGRLALPLGRR